MPPRTERVNQLNPSKLIQEIEKFVESQGDALDEVFIRRIISRIISSLYLSLFNFWASKRYFLENKRGSGPNQDRFSYFEFVADMISSFDLDAEIHMLHSYRIAADHYILNPAMIKHEGRSEDIFGKREEITISASALKKILEAAKEILARLQG